MKWEWLKKVATVFNYALGLGSLDHNPCDCKNTTNPKSNQFPVLCDKAHIVLLFSGERAW